METMNVYFDLFGPELQREKETTTGASLTSWSQIDVFGLCAHYDVGGKPTPAARWQGPGSEFLRLEWR